MKQLLVAILMLLLIAEAYGQQEEEILEFIDTYKQLLSINRTEIQTLRKFLTRDKNPEDFQIYNWPVYRSHIYQLPVWQKIEFQEVLHLLHIFAGDAEERENLERLQSFANTLHIQVLTKALDRLRSMELFDLVTRCKADFAKYPKRTLELRQFLEEFRYYMNADYFTPLMLKNDLEYIAEQAAYGAYDNKLKKQMITLMSLAGATSPDGVMEMLSRFPVEEDANIDRAAVAAQLGLV